MSPPGIPTERQCELALWTMKYAFMCMGAFLILMVPIGVWIHWPDVNLAGAIVAGAISTYGGGLIFWLGRLADPRRD